MYIYRRKAWPDFKWNDEQIITLLAEVRHLQGRLLGKMENLGFQLQNEANLETLTLDIIKNNEIEGEFLDTEQVRSSIAKHLGLDYTSPVQPSRYVDGVVEMMLDATQNYPDVLTKNRLFGWHATLFPTGWSGMYKITVGDWRKDDKGAMQVMSGAMGKEKVHFEALIAGVLEAEMSKFLEWFNAPAVIDEVLKAAIAHLWFITIHPFDDGNGRLARAITDMSLARSDQSKQRFYSMSAQILLEKKGYYDILERTQKGNLDISLWLIWFLDILKKSIITSESILEKVLIKAAFWKKHGLTIVNPRQQKMINMLFDGFKGKLSTSKWAKICKCSRDTALRDIQDLEEKGMLKKMNGGGRNTAYEINFE